MKDKKAVEQQHPQLMPNPAKQARNNLPWNALEQQVVRMQKQISQAYRHGDRQSIPCNSV